MCHDKLPSYLGPAVAGVCAPAPMWYAQATLQVTQSQGCWAKASQRGAAYRGRDFCARDIGHLYSLKCWIKFICRYAYLILLLPGHAIHVLCVFWCCSFIQKPRAVTPWVENGGRVYGNPPPNLSEGTLLATLMRSISGLVMSKWSYINYANWKMLAYGIFW